MKKLLSTLLLLSTFINSMGMAPLEMEVYFTPENQIKMFNTLTKLMNSAHNQILVATYWITDKTFFENLIKAHQRGVNIQIIIDESCPELSEIIQKLMDNQIIALVYPSKSMPLGIMHNKYLIFDNSKIWTGSANLTHSAFNANKEKFNYENSVFFNSTEIAAGFTKNFLNIENDIFDLYAIMIAENCLPDWLTKIATTLFRTNPQFNQVVHQSYQMQNDEKLLGNMSIFFPDLTKGPVTDLQLSILEKYGIAFKKEEISQQEANELIQKTRRLPSRASEYFKSQRPGPY